MLRLGSFVLCTVLILGAGGCGGGGSSATSYEDRVMQDRVQRDMQMREENSVLPPERRRAFRGLDYYPVDPSYRFVVPFQPHAAPDTVMLAENTGRVRAQARAGHVKVPLPSGDVRLAVFRGASDDPRGRLWVPFADATNGDSTYAAGRYVDLIPAPGDSVVVDFNRAYNPTCTYNPEYACPLPPEQNQLAASIPAGEKTPKFRGASTTVGTN
jgi:uncharacterized protein (DUF1684 family)